MAEDLIQELRSQVIAIIYPEEPLPRDHPIRQAKHAVLSSPRAGAMGEALQNIGRLVTNDIEAICQGLVPQYMQVAQPEFIRLRGQRPLNRCDARRPKAVGTCILDNP